jgi:hypothetical protein
MKRAILLCFAGCAAAYANAPDTANKASTPLGRIDIVSATENLSSFNLGRFTPSGDSCTELIINFKEKANAFACFRYDQSRRWHFENIGYYDSTLHTGAIRVNVGLDNEMRLVRAKILLSPAADSMRLLPAASLRRGDLPAPADSTAPLRFSVERNAFLCEPYRETTVVERKFTYPSWYMRREPSRLNYPELSMFHYGSFVRLPTPASINERGFLINYWHILHPDELEYENRGKK